MSEANKSVTTDSPLASLESWLRGLIREEIQAANKNDHHGGQLLSAEVAGKLWGVPTSWIRDMARRGELPHVKLGHYTRFKPDDLARFIQERRKEPSHPLPRNPALVKKSA